MTDDQVPRARSFAEMDFAASLTPCPHCGTREPSELDLVGSGDRWTLTGDCVRCRQPRTFTCRTYGDPLQGRPPRRHLGGDKPSEIIRPAQFIAELDRLLPRIRPEPTQLAPIEWRASTAANERALTCLNELLKFVEGDGIPEACLDEAERADRAARPERYARAWLEQERDAATARADRYTADAPRIWKLEEAGDNGEQAEGALDADALRAHERWLANKRKGKGRRVVRNFDMRDQRLAGAEMTAAKLESGELGGANLEAAELGGSELRDLRCENAVFTSVTLTGATIDGGSFAGADLRLARLQNLHVDGTTFERADFDRSTWKGAVIVAASFDAALFGDAVLDGATFRGCTFRGADLAHAEDAMAATTRGTLFEDCDLRNTVWDGRDVAGARFIRCKLDGARGTPSNVTGIVVEDADLSPQGDGSDIGDLEDVLALWQRG